MSQFATRIARILVGADVLGAVWLTSILGVAYVAGGFGVEPASAAVILVQDTVTPAPTVKTPGQKPRAGHAAGDSTEARINDLHRRLHITAVQEPQWTNVAQTMRDNARTMEPLITKRAQEAKTANAIENLHSYEKLAETHIDGLRKFIQAFQTLYDGMPDDQKKIADSVFRHRGNGKAGKRG